jgi:hypothetical protein
MLPALETSTRLSSKLCAFASTVRKLNTNFVAHEKAIVELGDR